MSDLLIRNGTVIDGTGAPPVAHGAVLIRDNTIAAVGSERAIGRIDPATPVIDAAGGTILPGFIDCHAHITLENPHLFTLAQTPFSLHYYQTIDYMRRTLDAGITSVRDAGGADLGLKLAVQQGLVDGPRLQISISIMTMTGGHADAWMRSGDTLHFFMPHPGRPDGVADGVDGVRRKVREILRAGADIIKVCATGGVLSPTDHPEFTNYSPDELNAIVQEASYRRGTRVMAHAQGLEGVKNAIAAGVHSIEHAIWLDDEAIDMMLMRGTYVVPTLLAPLAVTEIPTLPEYAREQALEVLEIHSESIARAHQAGVRIAMGTDAGVMPHGTNLRELGLMVNIGMTPMEAIVATTQTAAACLGWQERVGTLQPGKLADVVIARTNPLEDIRSLENVDNIALVVKDGRIVKNRPA